jgi:hypothetical protein
MQKFRSKLGKSALLIAFSMQIIRKFDLITIIQIQISRAVVPRGTRFFFCWKGGPLRHTVVIVPPWVLCCDFLVGVLTIG